MEMRAQGATFTEIAVAIGYTDKGGAYKAVARAFRRAHGNIVELVEHYRETQNARLERAIGFIDEDIQAASLPALEKKLEASRDAEVIDSLTASIREVTSRRLVAIRLLKDLCERQARLLGLDMPVTTNVNVNDVTPAQLIAGGFKELNDERIRTAEATVIETPGITHLGEKEQTQ